MVQAAILLPASNGRFMLYTPTSRFADGRRYQTFATLTAANDARKELTAR